MGYGIVPIAVSLSQVESVLNQPREGFFRRLLGSPTAELIKKIKQQCRFQFDQDDVDSEDEPTLEEALVALLYGDPPM